MSPYKLGASTKINQTSRQSMQVRQLGRNAKPSLSEAILFSYNSIL